MFWKSAGVARWAYNFFLHENKILYEYGEKYVNDKVIRKVINNVLKPNTHAWLKEAGNNVMKQAVIDAHNAYQKFFKKQTGFPKFKSKKTSKPSFYVNYERLTKTQNGFRGEKLGFVKTSEQLPKNLNKYYSNPRITFDGKYWYLGIGYVTKKENVQLTDEILGIDLGIKSLAVVSNKYGNRYKFYKNINKSKNVKRLKEKLKREQRKHSKKLLKAKKEKRNYKECKNLEKQRIKVNHLYKRLTNIRNNHLHQITTEIVKTKPSRVVMEDLNVSGMMKNKHLAKALAEQKFYTFIEMMKYKCDKCGIEFVQVDRFYPSSKTCSCCGSIKKDLKLSDRKYICSECGLIIDRDLNASINLANYSLC